MADNQTQQRDQDVVTYGSFTGLRSDVTPERFESGDLAVGDNVDLDKSGRLSRRDGYALQRAGAVHSLWADPQQEFCLYVSGMQLMRLNADYSSAPYASLAGSGRMSYVRVDDRIYYSNGTDTGLIERSAGAARSWGLGVPGLPGVTSTVGNMPAGTYQFSLTQLRVDGQESGAMLAGQVSVPAGSGLVFALPQPDPAAVSWLLYLSTPNGDTLYLAAQFAVGTASYTYANDTTELNLPLSTQFLQPPPAGQLVAYYRGRMYVAVDDVLYPSSPYGYELFDLREYIPLDGRITMLAPFVDKSTAIGKNSGLFIGTDRSCGILAGNDPSEFEYTAKTNYGAIPGALTYVDGALFGDDKTGARQLPMWLTTQGVCIGMPDMQITNLTRSRYTFPAAGFGAAIFMPGPNRFIATANL